MYSKVTSKVEQLQKFFLIYVCNFDPQGYFNLILFFPDFLPFKTEFLSLSGNHWLLITYPKSENFNQTVNKMVRQFCLD